MTTLLEQELAPLNSQIENILEKREMYEERLGAVTAELEKYTDARQRFDALQDVCNALDKLVELNAGELFWKAIPGEVDAAGHLKRVRGRMARFEEKICGIQEDQAHLQWQVDQRNEELAFLYEEVQQAYEREERRREEFVVEREISPVPHRTMVMPWSKEAESESRLRRAVLVALLICIVLGTLVPLVNVPTPDYSVAMVEIPERLARLVKQEPPRPAPPPKPVPKEPPDELQKLTDESKPASEKKKPEEPPKRKAPTPEPVQVAKSGGEAAAARKKAERVGVLAFKSAFADLMEETPVAKLGTEARFSKESPRVAGQAVAQRSLVAMQAQGGSSGGIANAGISRNIGYGNGNQIGGSGIGQGGGNGLGFSRVQSSIGGVTESARPLSDGPGAGRTDEEIQIVFDRYKAALYRVYNRELRKDPTLRGNMLLRISIETSGAVSLCKVESTDLQSPELVAKIIERIKRFNFGPKEGVPKITILYPIDFLPAA